MVIRLSQLQHSNGRPVIQLYGPWGKIQSHLVEENDDKQSVTNHDVVGPTIAFNVLRSDGSFVGYNEVSKLAALAKNPIQFRVGCFCNPGACAEAVGLSEDQVLNNYEENGHVCGDHIDVINGFPTGAVRVSFGKDSIWEDLDAACTFFDKMFVDRTDREGKVSITSTEVEETVGVKTNKDVQLTQIYLFPIKSCAGRYMTRCNMTKKCPERNILTSNLYHFPSP